MRFYSSFLVFLTGEARVNSRQQMIENKEYSDVELKRLKKIELEFWGRGRGFSGMLFRCTRRRFPEFAPKYARCPEFYVRDMNYFWAFWGTEGDFARAANKHDFSLVPRMSSPLCEYCGPPSVYVSLQRCASTDP